MSQSLGVSTKTSQNNVFFPVMSQNKGVFALMPQFLGVSNNDIAKFMCFCQ